MITNILFNWPIIIYKNLLALRQLKNCLQQGPLKPGVHLSKIGHHPIIIAK